MAAGELSEVVKAMRDALVADSSLTALLASATSVYHGWPEDAVDFPIVTLKILRLNPDTSIARSGMYQPEWDLQVFAISKYDVLDIVGYLDNNWNIPGEHAAAIDAANYSIRRFRIGEATDLPRLQMVDTGEWIDGMSCACRSQVHQVPA